MAVNTFTDTPIGSHTLAQDQPTIEGNFLYFANTLGSSQINKAAGTKPGDHQISLTSTDATQFEGRHLSVSLKNQASTYAHPGDGTDTFLYSSNGDLWARNSASAQLQLTSLSTISAANATQGFSFLPGAVMIAWGTVVIGGAATGTVTFANAPGLGGIGQSFPNGVFGVHATLNGSSAQEHVMTIVSFSKLQFVWHWNGTVSFPSFFWTAIGN